MNKFHCPIKTFIRIKRLWTGDCENKDAETILDLKFEEMFKHLQTLEIEKVFALPLYILNEWISIDVKPVKQRKRYERQLV